MEKTLCFILGQKKLYLEETLIDFNDIPVFFTCKDNDRHRYIAICADIDTEHYIVAESKLKDILEMLNGTLSMQNLILKTQKFWDITAEGKTDNDIVVVKPITELDPKYLPEKDAEYIIATEKDQEYVKELETERKHIKRRKK